MKSAFPRTKSTHHAATVNQSPGAQRVSQAGRLGVMPAYDQMLAGSEPVTDTQAINQGTMQSFTCTARSWSASEVRELHNTVALNAQSGVIYLGALIQGGTFETGQFTPITISRAGRNIYMTGVKLAPEAKYAQDYAIAE